VDGTARPTGVIRGHAIAYEQLGACEHGAQVILLKLLLCAHGRPVWLSFLRDERRHSRDAQGVSGPRSHGSGWLLGV